MVRIAILAIALLVSGCVSMSDYQALQDRVANIEKSKAQSAMLLAEQTGARKFWWRNGLTGGGDNLDGINAGSLTDGDVAIVAYKDGTTMTLYFYIYDSDDATSESSPTVIEPDAGGGGAWFLASVQVVGVTGNAADGTHYVDMSNTATLDAGSRADGRCWYAKDNNRIECYDGSNVQYWTATGNE